MQNDVHFPIWRLIGMEYKELQQLPDAVGVLFTDGHKGVYTRESILVSACCWNLYKTYPQGPVTKVSMLSEHLSKGNFTTGTVGSLCSAIVEEVVGYHERARFNHINTGVKEFDYINFLDPIHKDVKARYADEARYLVYDRINAETSAYVVSVSWLDFAELQAARAVQKIIKSVRTNPSDENIVKQTREAEFWLLHNTECATNAVVRAVRAGMYRMNQAVQNTFFRGVTTEVDNALHVFPVLTNYSLGLNNVHDFICDAQTARKAHFNAERPLQDVIWFSRRLELLASYVERLYAEDCGTKNTLPWRVRAPIYDDAGLLSYPGDLAFMVGKNFIHPDTGRLETVTAELASRGWETLAGKVIGLRSAIKCGHHDPQGVCSVCFGQLSHNVDPFDNLGITVAVSMMQQTSQLVLSTKHVAASAIALAIAMNAAGARYLEVDSGGTGYKVRKDLVGKPMKLYVNRAQAYGMTDIMLTDLDDITPSRISKMTEIRMERMEGDVLLTDVFAVAQSKRLASFTLSFIAYLRTVGWVDDGQGNFVIELEGWDNKEPMMQIPDMEYFYVDHAKVISTVIESSNENFKKPECSNPETVLKELFDVVNQKLKVNLACLEVLVYAAMTPSRDNFGMARGAPHPVVNVASQTTNNRSMATGLANESIHKQLSAPESFNEGNRPDSIFDALLAPQDVSEEIYQAIGHRP